MATTEIALAAFRQKFPTYDTTQSVCPSISDKAEQAFARNFNPRLYVWLSRYPARKAVLPPLWTIKLLQLVILSEAKDLAEWAEMLRCMTALPFAVILSPFHPACSQTYPISPNEQKACHEP
jgi:hypothetical protein